MTIAGCIAGIGVLDLSGLTGVTLGGTPASGDGVRGTGNAGFLDSDTGRRRRRGSTDFYSLRCVLREWRPARDRS